MSLFTSENEKSRIDDEAGRTLVFRAMGCDALTGLVGVGALSLTVTGFVNSGVGLASQVVQVPIVSQAIGLFTGGAGFALIVVGFLIAIFGAFMGMALWVFIVSSFRGHGVNVFTKSVVFRFLIYFFKLTPLAPGLAILPVYTIFTKHAIKKAREEDAQSANQASEEALV